MEKIMRGLAGLIAALIYFAGLAELFIHSHIVWMIVGIFVPFVPWFYLALQLVHKFL
jgi:hypothetical protein